MSETTPDAADVHTGTDRVELTDGLSRLREVAVEVAANALREAGTHYNSILHADKVARLAIEASMPSFVERFETAEAQLRTEGWLDAHGACMEIERKLAARVQALTAERDQWKFRAEIRSDLAPMMAEERDAARAELAAANAELDRLAALKGRVDELAEYAERAQVAEARCTELEEEIMAHQVSDGYTKGYEHGTLTTAKFKAERDALQETLNRVTALADEWDGSDGIEIALGGADYVVSELRAALTPEGKPQ